jgi:hypothetical protein
MRDWLVRRLAPLFLLLLVAACASGRSTGGEGADRNVLEGAELENSLHANAYVLIQALRPHWLEVRGGSGRMVKRVYLDEMYLGGVALLRQLSTVSIEQIQYFDGPAATQRWGVGHDCGVV